MSTLGMIILVLALLGPDRWNHFSHTPPSSKPSRMVQDDITDILRPSQAPRPAAPKGPAPEKAPIKNPARQSQISRQLAALTVIRTGSMAGYSRDEFTHWVDLEGNGCDARADILRRDAREITTTSSDNCKPQRGSWVDPYGGGTLTDSGDLDIDHVIPLAAAWRLGAVGWTSAKRRTFANDPLNLLAVDASLNRQKGDKLADAWRPPRAAYGCAYAQRTVRVHVKYKMGVTAAEKAALARMLGSC